MTITTEDPPVAELALREGESGTGPGWCAMCGRTPCEMTTVRPRADEICYYPDARPETVERVAKRVAHHALDDLGLPMSSVEWLPGTSDVLRAVAAELTEWAARGDRAAQRGEAGE